MRYDTSNNAMTMTMMTTHGINLIQIPNYFDTFTYQTNNITFHILPPCLHWSREIRTERAAGGERQRSAIQDKTTPARQQPAAALVDDDKRRHSQSQQPPSLIYLPRDTYSEATFEVGGGRGGGISMHQSALIILLLTTDYCMSTVMVMV